MTPNDPSTWSHTAVEYAVMSALSIQGYKDISPNAGYSRHSCMVPAVECLKSNGRSPSDDYFVDFSVISDEQLFNSYVKKALKRHRITLTQVSGGFAAELKDDDQSIVVNSKDNFKHNACLGILQWFKIKTVPDSIHRFEQELKSFLEESASD